MNPQQLVASAHEVRNDLSMDKSHETIAKKLMKKDINPDNILSFAEEKLDVHFEDIDNIKSELDRLSKPLSNL